MLTQRIRFFLIAIVGSLGVFQLLAGRSEGWFLVAATGLLVYGHFRHGPIWLAYRHARAGRLPQAERLLAEIGRPDRLSPQSRAYYYLLLASSASERGDYSDARQLLGQLDVEKLRTENDRCAGHALRAEVMLELGELGEAREHLAQAQRLDHKARLAAHLEELAKRIAAA